MLPGLARYTFPDYRSHYDGQPMDVNNLPEDIPAILLEEKEDDTEVEQLSQQSFVNALFDGVKAINEKKNESKITVYRPRDSKVSNKVVLYEDRTREMLDKIAAGSSRRNWGRFL